MLKSKTELYNQVKDLKLVVKTLKKEKALLQYQLEKAVNDIWQKSLRLKEYEKNGRISKK
tara:strand:- start:1239 stop:1418 length:180 start_codon:yes stop_codon:yes gene_type:complete